MRFRLVPKSSTLDDLELLYVQIFSEFCASWHVWEATTARPALSARELLRTESTFQRYTTLILLCDPKWGPIS